MGAIEDTRKVLQDFLTPEISELKARLDALKQRMDQRFESAEKLAYQRHEALRSSINGQINCAELRERITKLESTQSVHH